MLNFMRKLLETFKALSSEQIAQTANVILTIRFVETLAKELGCTKSLAGQVIGAMTLNVADNYYNDDPALFHDLVDESVRVICLMYDAYSSALGPDAALELIKAGAKDMSLTCSG